MSRAGGRFGSAPGVIDIGVLAPQERRLSGVVGSETGAATVFYDFETTEEARVAIVPVLLNAWTTPMLQWFIRKLDDGPERMEEDLEVVFRPRQGEGELSFVVPPGRFRLTIATQSWYSIPYEGVLVIRGAGELSAEKEIEVVFSVRLNHAAVEASKDIEVETEGQLSNNVNIGKLFFDGYVAPGYWEVGYSIGDEGVSGKAAEFAIEGVVTADIAVVSPFVN